MLIEQIILENRLPKITELYALKVGNQLLKDGTAGELVAKLKSKEEPELERIGAHFIKYVYDDIDITPNGKYTQWLVSNYAKGNIQYEDLYKFNEYFEIFDRLKQRLEKKDINQYSAQEFGQDMFLLRDRLENEEQQMSQKAQVRQAKREFSDNVKELYSDNDWEIYMPLNRKGCIAVGNRTDWCTAKTQHNYADSYLGRGPLYVWQSLNDKLEMYQMHLPTLKEVPLSLKRLPRPEIRDRTDATINKETIKKLPKIKAIIQKVYGNALGSLVYAAKVGEDLPADFSNLVGDDPIMALLHLGLVLENGEERQAKEIAKKYTPLFRKDPVVAYTYAKEILKNRWPEAEKTILQDPSATFNYARDVIQGEWPEAESTFLQSPEVAYKYARDVLKEPWPRGEKTILQDPEIAYQYAKLVKRSPWPELEKTLGVGDINVAKQYIDDVVKKRYPPLEPVLKADSKIASEYARDYLEPGERFEAAEPTFLKAADSNAVNYASEILGVRWPELEKRILEKGDSEAALNYMLDVARGNWPEGEKLIAQSEENMILYKEILDDPSLRDAFFGN